MNILITGNPVDGLQFKGPYPDASTAVDAGDDVDGEWWVGHLEPTDHPVGEALQAAQLQAARQLVSEQVREIFHIELANEEAMRREAMSKQRPHEEPPATTLSTVVDSIRQGLPLSAEPYEVLVSLLAIRDMLPGTTEVRELL